jgi:hypothetical protein
MQFSQIWRFVIVSLALLGLVLSSQLAAQSKLPPIMVIACPRNQEVLLEGTATPGAAVLVLFGERVIGGDSVDSSGRWRVPIRVNEPQGTYPVDVVERGSRTVVARYTCVVDLPLESVATLTPSATPIFTVTLPPTATNRPTLTQAPATATVARPVTATLAPNGGSGQPTSTATATGTTAPGTTVTVPTATSNQSAGATFTPSPTRGTTTPTLTPSATTTGRSGPPTNTPGPTAPPAAQGDVTFLASDAGDPATANDDEPNYGYVLLANDADYDVTMTGWQIVNVTRPSVPRFTFPQFILPYEGPVEGGGEVEVFPEAGESSIGTSSTLYWGIKQFVWLRGDLLELRTAQGVKIAERVVE